MADTSQEFPPEDDILLEIAEREDDARTAEFVRNTKICYFNCSAHDEQVIQCKKCQRYYCIIHASKFSPNFCQDCFKNLSLIVDKFEKRTEDYNPQTDTVNVRKESCTRLRFDGPDWIFYTAWIDKLSDDDMKTVHEFHFFILKMIEHDNEVRKINHAKKLRDTPLPKGSLQTQTTKTTKTTKTAKPVDLRAMLKKMNPRITDAQLDAMVTLAQSSDD